MQKTTCADCGCTYWLRNWSDTKPCPACGGTGDISAKCSECASPLKGWQITNGAKTCGHECANARKARLEREKRRARGLKRNPRERLMRPTNRPMETMRKCHDCGNATTDYRCAHCRAKWRARHGADGLNGLAELFTAGQCFADVG